MNKQWSNEKERESKFLSQSNSVFFPTSFISEEAIQNNRGTDSVNSKLPMSWYMGLCANMSYSKFHWLSMILYVLLSRSPHFKWRQELEYWLIVHGCVKVNEKQANEI